MQVEWTAKDENANTNNNEEIDLPLPFLFHSHSGSVNSFTNPAVEQSGFPNGNRES